MTSNNRRARRAARLTRAVLLGAGVAVVVTGVAFVVRSRFDPVLRLDESAIRSATAYTRARPALRSSLLTLQQVMQPLNVYVVMTVVCLWVWLRRGLRTRAWWAFATMMVGWNLALDVKYLVQRARPVVEDAVAHAPGYSFPSGHAANAAIATTTLVVLLWPVVTSRAWRAVLVVGAVVLTVATALDRVLLGVHYPTDVVGGVLLGTGLVLASYAGYLDWNPQPTPTASDPDQDPTTEEP